MTTAADIRLARADRYTSEAADLFEAGFMSKAAKKRALESASRAYEEIRGIVMSEILDRRTAENEEENRALYWAVPMDLHLVRDKHFALLADFPIYARARDLVALRNEIKTATIAAIPVNTQAEKVETIRRSIIEELEARHANFVEGLDLSKRLGGLSVYANAHYCFMQNGTRYVRYFFYLHGKLTALNSIMAIAETMEREEAAKAAR